MSYDWGYGSSSVTGTPLGRGFGWGESFCGDGDSDALPRGYGQSEDDPQEFWEDWLKKEYRKPMENTLAEILEDLKC